MKLQNYEKEHIKSLRAGLAECLVLLKTDGAFPLKKAGTIAAYGSGVRSTIKGGTGSGEVNSRYFVNIEKGLENAGFTITTKEWLDAYEEVRKEAHKEFISRLKAEAKSKHVNVMIYGMGKPMPEPEYDLPLSFDSDAAIYVVSRISGEGNDRDAAKGDILLTDSEIRDILALQANYEKFMLVLNVGGPVDLSPVADKVGNILILSQLGVETGNALAAALIGKFNPSGKLTTSWSAWEDYCRDVDFGADDDTYYNEGIFVGYRYFDTVGRKALFPFGYGKSYTTFELGKAEVTADGEMITVKVPVTNTGDRAGKEVVQVYVSAPDGKLPKAYQDLAGFAKTKELKSGEEEIVTVSFAMSSIASYNEEQEAYILEKGAYVVRVGNSSVDTEEAALLILSETVITKKVRSIIAKSDFEDKTYPRRAMTLNENLPSLYISADSFECRTFTYDAEEEILPETGDYSDEELAYFNIGAFNPKGGVLSIIGNASMTVPGAAGESVGLFKERNVPAMVMADGPAGLRLTKQYYEDEKGIHAIGSAGIPESMLDFLPGPAKFAMSLMSGGKTKVPAGTEVKEQFATAIPIGTAIAQTWNPEFAEKCGDIVGDEMERLGVHLWLAPALNIHRSILCGRNFEYYSEDPLVSGLFAAGITRGVQKHEGCGTTIKHYCANNQEHNRMNNNSHVSERAMREIYLRGFEICVELSQPYAVMTSYNLLNGTHTSETRGLLQDYLRTEAGYEGIIMTDWVIKMAAQTSKLKYRHAEAAMVAKAGGDLFMPGCKKDYEEVLEAIKNGTLSREQLEINASRVIKMARKLVK